MTANVSIKLPCGDVREEICTNSKGDIAGGDEIGLAGRPGSAGNARRRSTAAEIEADEDDNEEVEEDDE